MDANEAPGRPADVRPLAPEESRRYWDRRHRGSDSLAAGGRLGSDRGTNAMLYAVRIARLVQVFDGRTDPGAPLRVLDAGCGQGIFSRALASFGHNVDGIDTSSYAISVCQELAGPTETYAVSALEDWSPPHLYDAVLSIDVLYHVMDDGEWERSVTNLAAQVRLGGIIGLVDHDCDETRVWADYQKTRAAGRYRELLTESGFRWRSGLRNDFGNDPSIMHLATRAA